MTSARPLCFDACVGTERTEKPMRVYGEPGQYKMVEGILRVAVGAVLLDRVPDVLAVQRVLQLGREDRDPVEEQHQVEAVLVLLAVHVVQLPAVDLHLLPHDGCGLQLQVGCHGLVVDVPQARDQARLHALFRRLEGPQQRARIGDRQGREHVGGQGRRARTCAALSRYSGGGSRDRIARRSIAFSRTCTLASSCCTTCTRRIPS